VNFVIGDLGDINNLVGEVADLAGAAEVAQDIRDREAKIDSFQEPDIADVLEPAFGGYRQEFQLVAVVEDGGEIIGERAEDEVWGAGGPPSSRAAAPGRSLGAGPPAQFAPNSPGPK